MRSCRGTWGSQGNSHVSEPGHGFQSNRLEKMCQMRMAGGCLHSTESTELPFSSTDLQRPRLEASLLGWTDPEPARILTACRNCPCWISWASCSFRAVRCSYETAVKALNWNFYIRISADVYHSMNMNICGKCQQKDTNYFSTHSKEKMQFLPFPRVHAGHLEKPHFESRNLESGLLYWDVAPQALETLPSQAAFAKLQPCGCVLVSLSTRHQPARGWAGLSCSCSTQGQV